MLALDFLWRCIWESRNVLHEQIRLVRIFLRLAQVGSLQRETPVQIQNYRKMDKSCAKNYEIQTVFHSFRNENAWVVMWISFPTIFNRKYVIKTTVEIINPYLISRSCSPPVKELRKHKCDLVSNYFNVTRLFLSRNNILEIILELKHLANKLWYFIDLFDEKVSSTLGTRPNLFQPRYCITNVGSSVEVLGKYSVVGHFSNLQRKSWIVM